MKKSLRFLLFSLCLVLLLCSCDKGQAEVTANISENVVTSADENTLEIPLSADFGKSEYRVFSAGNLAYEDFTAEEDSAMPLDEAQYKRKKLVEQNYNVVIEEDTKVAYSSGNGPGFTAIYTNTFSGTATYSAGLIAGYDVSVLAYCGCLYDMNSMPGIDLSKSWWDQEANKALGINGLMFFTAGDYTFADNDAAYVIMFNKKIMEDYGLPNPYDMVYANEWTLENFGNLCKTVTEDLNQDSIMDENDRFGLLVWVDSLLGMVNAAGQRCCEIDKDGQIVLTLYNETTLDAVDRFLAIALDKQYALQYQSIQNNVAFEEKLWSGGHGLFWTTHMGNVPRFRNMESDFGLLPYPKLTSSQDEYYSTVTPFNSQFVCIPIVQENIERTGVVTEALAYYGKKDVLPVYYDVNLKGRVSRDAESSDMLDIIFDNLVYDIGFLYQIGPYNKNFNYMVSRGTTNFNSVYDSLLPTAEAQLQRINSEYAKAVSIWQGK